MSDTKLASRRWPLIVKPNLEPLEERYAPGKAVELLELSFLIPGLLRNQHTPSREIQLLRSARSFERKGAPAQAPVAKQPWFAGFLQPMKMRGFHGQGTRDGAFFQTQLSSDQQHDPLGAYPTSENTPTPRADQPFDLGSSFTASPSLQQGSPPPNSGVTTYPTWLGSQNNELDQLSSFVSTQASSPSVQFKPANPSSSSSSSGNSAGSPSTTGSLSSKPSNPNIGGSGVGTRNPPQNDIVVRPSTWTDWTFEETGGVGAGKGSYTITGSDVILREGNSFTATLWKNYPVPVNPRNLIITYDSLVFDTTAANRIKDAFEIGFVNPTTGQTQVYPYTRPRDVAYNVTDGVVTPGFDATHTQEVIVSDGKEIRIDISQLDMFGGTTPATQFKVFVRLVNNDQLNSQGNSTGDENTLVRLRGQGASDPLPAVTVGLLYDTFPIGAGAPYTTDKLTNDSRLTGTATDNVQVTMLEASIDGGTYQNITTSLSGSNWTWNPGTLSAGQHTIAIRAKDNLNQTTTQNFTFTVNSLPTANAGGNRTTNEGTSLLFDASGSSDLEGIYSYQWTKPDTTSTSSATFNHLFSDNGSFTAVLQITDTAGSVHTNTATITVNNVPPTLVISGNSTVNEGSVYTLNLSSSDPGTDTITGWNINWGNGTQFVSGNPASVTRTYPDGANVYPISATATDEDGTWNSNSINVTVLNVAPTLTISGAATVNEGSTYTLNLSRTDPGVDTITQWLINWGDGNSQTVPGNPSTVTHVYADGSVSRIISATATDEDGTFSSNSINVNVLNVAPTLTISGAASVNEGSTYTLNLGRTDPGQDTITQWIINWGDGNTQTVSGNPGSVTHVYTDGLFSRTISANATDEDGTFFSNNLTINVNNLAPVVTAPSSYNQFGMRIIFTANFTDVGVLDTHTATVNWGDGSSSSTGIISETNGSGTVSITTSDPHVYATPGNYNVTITVTDNGPSPLSGSVTFPVTVTGTNINPDPWKPPGVEGELKTITITLVNEPANAAYQNELGLFIVDNLDGKVGGVTPSQSTISTYAPAALNSPGRKIVFDQNASVGATYTLQVPSTALLGFYLVQNSTTALQLSNNPTNVLSGTPNTFFSTRTLSNGQTANPDNFKHFRSRILPNGVTQFEVEDLDNGGDQDFNDLIFQVSATASENVAPVKFHVVDSNMDRNFQYNADGKWTGLPLLNSANVTAKGNTANADGTKMWVIDANKTVYVYDLHPVTGVQTFAGSWTATGMATGTVAEDIALLGNDIHVVTSHASTASSRRVYRYSSASTRISGTQAAASSFQLNNTSPNINSTPTGLAAGTVKIAGVNTQRIWVTNDGTNEVFVYSGTGSYVGKWQLDSANADPSDLTHDPSAPAEGSSTNLWVLDKVDKKVYTYSATGDGAVSWMSGSKTASGTFDLAYANVSPEGIADPPPPTVQRTHEGKDFWFAVPPIGIGAVVRLSITSQNATSGVLHIPSSNFTLPFNVVPGKVTILDGLELMQVQQRIYDFWNTTVNDNDLIGNKSIHITSFDDISVSLSSLGLGFLGPAYTSDSALLLPKERLGNNYYVISYNNNVSTGMPGDPGSLFTIVATENNTSVTITPSDDAETRTANSPYTIVLNQGQTYLLAAKSFGADLTGTSIVSDKKIAVLSGHKSANIPNNLDAADHLLEQLPPTESWGREFITAPLATRTGGDVFRIVASQNGTMINVNGVQAAVLNAGQFFETTLSLASHITSNHGVLVAQYAHSTLYDHSPQQVGWPPGDPFMMLVPAVGQYVTSFELGAGHGETRFDNYVSIVAPTIATSTINMDGVLLNPSSFLPIGTSGYSYLTLPVSDGLIGNTYYPEKAYHNFTSTTPFMVYSYGWDSPEGIGHPAGMGLPLLNRIQSIQLTPETAVMPTGAPDTLTATVTDNLGAPVAAVPVRFTVSGTHSPVGYAITNSLGQASFTYLGSIAGLDTITASTNGYSDTAQVTWVATPMPTILVSSPPHNSSHPSGTTLLITGKATLGINTAPIRSVVMNGRPVDALDSAGNFFVRTTLQPGSNQFHFTATDSYGRIVETNHTLVGIQTPSDYIPFDQLVSVAGFQAEYQRTSFDAGTSRKVLYADLAIRNTSSYHLGNTLVVGITGISNTLVNLSNADGVTPDGIPYVNLSSTIPGLMLEPNEVTGTKTLAFNNPSGIPFSYHLVLLGELNHAPEYQSIPTIDAYVGRGYQYPVLASDADSDVLSYELIQSPTNMTIVSTTGAITWTPQSTQIGQHQVQIRVRDGRGGSATQQFQLTVSNPPANRPPLITSFPITSTAIGVLYTYDVESTDLDGDTVTYTLENPPGNADIVLTTGVISWTPQYIHYGNQLFTVVANDGNGGITRQVFTVNVGPVPGNRDPIITSEPPKRSIFEGIGGGPTFKYIALVGEAYPYIVQATDPDNDTLTFSKITGPTSLQVASTGQLVWTPLVTQVGIHLVEIQVADGRGGFDVQSYSVEVIDERPGSIAGELFNDLNANGTKQGNEPPLVNWRVFADANKNLRYDFGEASAFTTSTGTYVINGLISGEYQIAVERQEGWRVTYPSTFAHTTYVSPNFTTSGINFGLTVITPGSNNQAPQFTTTPVFQAEVGVLYAYEARATDLNGDPLTYSLAAAPAGMVIDSTTGTIHWTPGITQRGTHPVVVTVRDDFGGLDVQQYQIAVISRNHPPIIISEPPLPVIQNQAYRYELKAIDPDGDTVSYHIADTPPGGGGIQLVPGMSVDSVTGFVTWLPQNAGIQEVWFEVRDGRGGKSYQFVEFTVAATGSSNHAPVITSNPPPQQAHVGMQYLYPPEAYDVDNDPLTWSLTTFPTGMQINTTTGLITWSPTTLQSGSHSVVLRVQDGRGGLAQQSFNVVVSSGHSSNNPPSITSTPPHPAILNELYLYPVVATDPDNDTLSFRLESGPAGATIDPVTGILYWTPDASQVGTHEFKVRAQDPFGGSAQQSFQLSISVNNSPPIITSTPVIQAEVNKPYVYAVLAQDPDLDPLQYELEVYPDYSMNISSDGIVTWTPTATGVFNVTIKVSDGRGGLVRQVYQIGVNQPPTPPNDPPVITSNPTGLVTAQVQYLYPLTATDPQNDPITFTLVNGPANMSLVSGNIISWTPTLQQVDIPFSVMVRASDPLNAYSYQQFTLTPVTNHAPVLEEIPNTSLTAGLLFGHDAYATDQDGDVLTYTLTGSPPSGMSIDESGRIRFQTTPAHANQSYSITVNVNDGRGAPNSQVSRQFTLNVLADTQAPQVELQTNPALPAQLNITEDIQFLLLVTDNVEVVERKLEIKLPNTQWVVVPLDIDGRGSYVTSVVGNYEVKATAIDSSNLTTVITRTFSVVDPTIAKPIIQLNPITSDGQVTTITPIVGKVAMNPNNGQTVEWKLELFQTNGNLYRNLTPNPAGSGWQAGEINAFWPFTITNLDPTLLENGPYRVVLTARNAGGTVSLEQNISIIGRLKLGNFAVSFTDLTIPVAGIPISVGRSYDTLRANQNGELGYGWQLTMGDAQLDTSLDPNAYVGTGWNYPAFLDGTRVFVTFPGGERQGFTFTPIAQPTGFGGVTYWHPAFTPDPGNTFALIVEDFTLVKQTNGSYLFTDYYDSYLYNPTRPVFGAIYTLLDVAGTKQNIDARSGELISVEDRRGNKLTYEENRIVSNRTNHVTGTPLQVTFQRDPEDRIIEVKDPRGNSVKYEYDAKGNLAAVVDRLGKRTTLTYYTGTGVDHYLDTVVDPLNRTALKAEYGTGTVGDPASLNGRLKAMTDASNETTRLGYEVSNPNAIQQTIIDPANYNAGNPSASPKTTITYDKIGNVTETSDPLGQKMQASYTDPFGTPANPKALYLPRKTTQVGNSNTTADDIVTEVKYDQRGFITESIDPLGKQSFMGFDDFGNVLSATDPLGNTVNNSYDPDKGMLLSTKSPGQPITTFTYTTRGDLETVTSAGVTSTMEYYDSGWKKKDIRLGQSGTTPTYITTNYDYDANGNSTGSNYVYTDYFTQATKTVTSSTLYDANDRAYLSTDADGNSSSSTYDQLDRVITSTDSFGQVSKTIYDNRGQVIESESSYGTVTRTIYDKNGRAIWTIDEQIRGPIVNNIHEPGPQTRGTYTIYDTAGRVKQVKRFSDVRIQLEPDGNGLKSVLVGQGTELSYTENWYDVMGRVERTRSTSGLETTFTYDKRGQQLTTSMVVSTLSGNQTITTSSTYDDAGKVLTSTDPLGRVTRTVYDVYARPYKTIFADDSFVEMGYDAKGRKAWDRQQRKVIDPIVQTDYEYDDLGRLTAVIQPQVDNGQGTLVRPRYEYSYDPFGNHVKTKDALNRETLFAYDFAGRQTSRTLPAAGGQNNIETWEYSTANDVSNDLFPNVGMLKKHIDFNGNENRPVYDNRGRLDVNRWYKPGNVLDQTVDYHYDNRGRMDSYTDYRGTTSYQFDIEGRTTQIASPEGTLNYEYNQTTGWHTRTYTTHNDTQYAYDQAGRLEKITVSKLGDTVYTTGNELTTTYGYNAAGLLTSILRKNGSSTIAKTENTYDLLHRIETITQKNAADVAFASYAYTRKSDGKISAVDEVTSGVNRRVEYLYDDLERLTQEKRSLTEYDVYQFDPVGNRTKLTKHTGSSPVITDYVYDARDRLQTETTGSNVTSYTYDPNGSQLIKDAPGADIETYTWDASNRLSGATINRGGTTTNTSYKYDDSGIRSEVTENGVVTKHLTDSMNPSGYAQVIEQTSGGVLLVSTVYGHEPIAQKDESGVSLYLAEAHSGTRLLIDVNAGILQLYVYDGYGKLLSGSAGTVANPVLYRGERFDSALGNYYLRARYYNQSSGLFNKIDPFNGILSSPLSLNKYAYTHNNPVNGIDPTGRSLVGLVCGISLNLALTALDLLFTFKVLKYLLASPPIIDPSLVSPLHKQFASLCSDVYNDRPTGDAGWMAVKPHELGRLGLNASAFKAGSFFAQLYHNGSGGFALAFRGTDDGPDWWSNIAQGGFGPFAHTQHEAAVALAESVDQAVRNQGGHLTMTGHSLGGGLAATAAIATNSPAVTFNAGGLNSLTEFYYGSSSYTNHTVNYSVQGELLTGLQTILAIAPSAFGEQYLLKPAPGDRNASPLTLHYMVSVLNALGIQKNNMA